MAQVFANGQIVEVSDTAIEVSVFGLKSFLQGKYGDSTSAKIRQLRVWLRNRSWKPVEAEALRRVLAELKEA